MKCTFYHRYEGDPNLFFVRTEEMKQLHAIWLEPVKQEITANRIQHGEVPPETTQEVIQYRGYASGDECVYIADIN